MQADIHHAYTAAHKRLFLLDYDGTLADLMPTPPEAKPTPELLDVLARLAADPANTVVIISGRPHETLQEWLGNLPLAFAAEHGLMTRQPGQAWQTLTFGREWIPDVQDIMQTYTDKLPGAILEHKTNALAWHCRDAADPALADTLQQNLIATLQPLIHKHSLRLIDGNKVVEVQPAGFDKGSAAKQWLDAAHWDFVLAAGDDTTDEDLFGAMPAQAFTFKVRDGNTLAKLQVSCPSELRALLASLTGSS